MYIEDLKTLREFLRFQLSSGEGILDRFEQKYLPVLALLKGSFSSHFEPGRKGPDSRMVVCGDAEFFSEVKFGSEENINLFLNLVDWMTADESLISIRSKVITQRPLDKAEETGKTIIKWLNIAFIPVLLAAIGIIMWRSNRNRKDFSLKR